MDRHNSSADGCMESAKSHSHHSRNRSFAGPFRTSKFWMRILRPWTWRKRKERLRRTNSDGMEVRSQTREVAIPSSLSSVDPLSTTELMNGESSIASQLEDESNSSLKGPLNDVTTLPSIELNGNAHCVTTEGFVVPAVQRVVIVDKADGSLNLKVCSAAFESDCPSGEIVSDDETASNISQAGNIDCDESVRESISNEESSKASRDETVSFEMDLLGTRKLTMEEVAAKEPDLSAQPNKPVLKKPGAPSRFRVVKRTSLRKVQPSENDVRSATLSKGDIANVTVGDLPLRLTDDSDSESDIQYRDDVPSPRPRRGIGHSTNPAIASRLVPQHSVDADDEDVPLSGLAARVNRRDTLAKKLDAPEPVNDIPNQTSDDRRRLMHKASIKLERKLSERPSAEELEQRNILKAKDASINSKKAMDETRKMLLRKLSFRPTIQQLKDKQIIKFNDYVEVTEAEAYDRKADKPWTRLTPTDKALIRKELNDFKATEMDVHEESRIFTRFHRP